MQKQGNIVWL